jgi:hypothetical protein
LPDHGQYFPLISVKNLANDNVSVSLKDVQIIAGGGVCGASNP